MDKIAVLIPCYNESKTIKKVINDYKEAIPEAVIYVYDNNSSDGTDKIAKKAAALYGKTKKELMDLKEVLPMDYSYGKSLDSFALKYLEV